jgi:glycosyltransferase A (GT-A) superfamily protein (DUF2064 family)
MGRLDVAMAIVVMAKAPIVGEVKTRLARDVGIDAAARLQRGFLLDTLALVEMFRRNTARLDQRPPALFILCPDERHAALLRELAPTPWFVSPQRRSGLMGGLVDAFETALTDGSSSRCYDPPELAILLDADSPSLPPEHLHGCARQCLTNDLVLGPTVDGGYYLIAARRTARDRLAALLLDERFDGATICEETLRRARALGLTAELGPSWFDVDTLDDLRALVDSLAGQSAGFLSHTRRELRAAEIDLVGVAVSMR